MESLMGKAFPVFTVEDGEVLHGAEVKVVTVAGMEVPVLAVGEEGRGRRLAALPVSGAAPGETLRAAEVEEVGGRLRLIARPAPTTDSLALVLFRSPIGFRGSNRHTGDRTSEGEFLPFPGEVLARGTIADGAAGRMGSGEQLIALLQKGKWVRAEFTGRRYGAPHERFYRFEGDKVIALTGEERTLLEASGAI